MGVCRDGTKGLIELGLRESAESWADLLRDGRRRGMRDPERVVGDGAMGLWKAMAGLSLYSMSKTALVGMANGLARELGPRDQEMQRASTGRSRRRLWWQRPWTMLVQPSRPRVPRARLHRPAMARACGAGADARGVLFERHVADMVFLVLRRAGAGEPSRGGSAAHSAVAVRERAPARTLR